MANDAIYLLNQSRDISLVKLIKKISPVPLTIIVTNFTAKDEYGWNKVKSLQQCISDDETQSLVNEIDGVVICKKWSILKDYMANCEVCMSRGREFFIFKEISKRNIALSLNRCYFNRLIDVLPHYKNMKVIMTSDKWLDKSCGNFMMGSNGYIMLDKYRDRFKGIDILGLYYEFLKKETKIQIRQRLNVPLDSKIAFVSFRMAQKEFSIHRDANSFMSTTKREIERLKDDGYYIISRRRMGQHDMDYYNSTNAPDISRYCEIAHLIDMEMNGSDGFPGTIWDGLYASDLLLLADISGICHYEVALCRCPVYMPFDTIHNINELNPATRDMLKRGLIFNKLTDINIKHYEIEIEEFVKEWYNTNVDLFWKEVLND